MSFVRPEVRRLLGRWAETAAAGMIALALVFRGLPMVVAGNVFGAVLTAAGVVALFWLRSALARALAAQEGEAPGVVEVREGEIRHFGPLSGGVVEIDALVKIEIFLAAEGFEPLWRLTAADGRILMIPAPAKGAERLIDAFDRLPGFSELAAAQALRRARPGRHVVWQRRGGAPEAAITGS